MGVEIVMIQRLILFLGHPVYSVSVVLAGLLFFAGIGSLSTGQSGFVQKRRRSLLLLLSLLILIEGFGLPMLLHAGMGLPMAGRLWTTLAVLAPLGFLMGMAFPLGIRYLHKASLGAMIPWAWAINGSASVAGAVLAVMVAMEIGFKGVFVVSALGYGVAAFCLKETIAKTDG